MGTFERHIVVGFVHLTGFRLCVGFLKLIHLELKPCPGTHSEPTTFYRYMYDVLTLEPQPFFENTTAAVVGDWCRTCILFITFTLVELARYTIVFQYIFDVQLIRSLLFIQLVAASVRGSAQSAPCET